MHYQGHLIFSGIVNGLFLVGLYMLFGTGIIEPVWGFPLVATCYIFSLLPDVDHPRSHISGIVFLVLLFVFGTFAYNFYKTLNLFDLIKMSIAVGIFIVHISYAEDSYLHRRFPHTFTFGIISCVILYFFANSIILTSVGAISFLTHIIGDGHLNEAIERDKEMWNRIIPS